MNLLTKLLEKKQQDKPAPTQQNSSAEEAVYLTATVTYGMHPYRRPDEDSSVYYVDEHRGIRKMIIDPHGHIQNFPGFVKEEFWVKQVHHNYLKPQVCFRSSFEKRDRGWIFLWQLQPDGWYWADEDGFGAENDSEVVLYTYLDRNGDFVAPFRIYQLDRRGYSLDRFIAHHDNSQKSALEAIHNSKIHVIYPDDIFPQLTGGFSNYSQEDFYQLKDKQETLAYWNEPVLREDLKALAQTMLNAEKSLWEMMGKASNRVHASVTLFWLVTEDPVFRQMLDSFFDGKLHEPTVKKLLAEEQAP